jgi:hypothetical protein
VSAWCSPQEAHLVHLYEGGGTHWVPTRTIGHPWAAASGRVGGGVGGGGHERLLDRPYGLRFTDDGAHVAVTVLGHGRVTLFRASDGAFVRHAVEGTPLGEDVHKFLDGWLVACCDANTVWWVSDDGTTRCTIGGGLHYPGAVATVPGLGIVVRQAYRKGLRVR